MAHALGFAALILILAEGGLTTPWPEIRPVMRLGVSLATIGVAVRVLVMAVFGHYVLGLSWELAILLGAITSPTDAAAVFSVLRRVPLPPGSPAPWRPSPASTTPRPSCWSRWISAGGTHGLLGYVGQIAWELGVGVAAAFASGTAVPGCCVAPRCRARACTRGGASFTVLAYAGSAALHGSGFAAVYVAALILGNAELPHRAATRSFSEGSPGSPRSGCS